MPKTAIPRVPSIADLRTVKNAVVEAGDLFRRHKDALAAVRERARVEAEASADQLSKFGATFNRSAMIKATVTKATKAYLDERAEKFGRSQKDISGTRNILDHGRSLYSNKRALLDMLTLGNPARAAYVQNLQNAGPAALINAASFALAEKNAALAAAVAAVVDAMPSQARPLAVAELVADLEVEQIEETMALFAEVDRLTVAAEVEAHDIAHPDGGRSADKIRLGLEQRRVGLQPEREGEPGSGPGLDAATAKISRGLAQRKVAESPAASGGEGASDAA